MSYTVLPLFDLGALVDVLLSLYFYSSPLSPAEVILLFALIVELKNSLASKIPPKANAARERNIGGGGGGARGFPRDISRINVGGTYCCNGTGYWILAVGRTVGVLIDNTPQSGQYQFSTPPSPPLPVPAAPPPSIFPPAG